MRARACACACAHLPRADASRRRYDYCFFHFGDDTSTSFRCMCGAPACRGTLDANPQRGLNKGRRIEVMWDDGIFYAATVTGYNASTGKARVRCCASAVLCLHKLASPRAHSPLIPCAVQARLR